MTMVASYLTNASFKKETTLVNFAPFIVPLTVTMMKRGVLAREMKWDVLSQINV